MPRQRPDDDRASIDDDVRPITGDHGVLVHPSGALPLPRLGAPERPAAAVYIVTSIDARGRLADASPVRRLGWTPGQTITLSTTVGAVTAIADPGGQDVVTTQGHLRLPADVRHALRLTAGDRLLVVAHPDRRLLVAYTMPTLDAMLADRPLSIHSGRPT